MYRVEAAKLENIKKSQIILKSNVLNIADEGMLNGIDSLYEEIENDYFLLGASGLEDEL
jgi:hypothetical protein